MGFPLSAVELIGQCRLKLANESLYILLIDSRTQEGFAVVHPDFERGFKFLGSVAQVCACLLEVLLQLGD
jgi:hypothetical protein